MTEGPKTSPIERSTIILACGPSSLQISTAVWTQRKYGDVTTTWKGHS
eukprot:CAMPEP_0180781060 /NCGR_PEP_ID=MMETSP1038_2-20121128/47404_1 /TAXON_ID=632150 /ORGANISM="Azadinium spinosum, Strain 3D9" /LENGTH=47 /DNA_ID= /DNA_START= /DNA_END= /DNA_ORIENTATION=